MDPPMTSLSSSATTAVSDGNDDDTDEFWNPMVKLFLTNSAQEHKYDWKEVRDSLSNSIPYGKGLKLTSAECELQFKTILSTMGVELGPGELSLNSHSVVTRLHGAQLCLINESYKTLLNCEIPSEGLAEELCRLRELDGLEKQGSDIGDDKLEQSILGSVATDEEDVEDPDPITMVMRKLRKNTRLQLQSGYSSDSEEGSSDSGMDDDDDDDGAYEHLMQLYKKWKAEEELGSGSEHGLMETTDLEMEPNTTVNDSVTSPLDSFAQPLQFGSGPLLPSGSSEKDKRIALILQGLYAPFSPENGIAQNTLTHVESTVTIPNPEMCYEGDFQSSASISSLLAKMDADTGEGAGSSKYAADNHDASSSIGTAVQAKEWDSPVTLTPPTNGGLFGSDMIKGREEAVEIAQYPTASAIPDQQIPLVATEEKDYPPYFGVNADEIRLRMNNRRRRQSLPSRAMVAQTPLTVTSRLKSKEDPDDAAKVRNGLLNYHSRVVQQKFGHTFTTLLSEKTPKGRAYHSVIKKPMCLNKIGVDVRKGVISNFDEYEMRLYLTLLNTAMYNRKNPEMLKRVETMTAESSKILDEYVSTQLTIARNKVEHVKEESAAVANAKGKRNKKVSEKSMEAGAEAGGGNDAPSVVKRKGQKRKWVSRKRNRKALGTTKHAGGEGENDVQDQKKMKIGSESAVECKDEGDGEERPAQLEVKVSVGAQE